MYGLQFEALLKGFPSAASSGGAIPLASKLRGTVGFANALYGRGVFSSKVLKVTAEQLLKELEKDGSGDALVKGRKKEKCTHAETRADKKDNH